MYRGISSIRSRRAHALSTCLQALFESFGAPARCCSLRAARYVTLICKLHYAHIITAHTYIQTQSSPRLILSSQFAHPHHVGRYAQRGMFMHTTRICNFIRAHIHTHSSPLLACSRELIGAHTMLLLTRSVLCLYTQYAPLTPVSSI